MACADKPQGRMSTTMGTKEKKGKETARSSSDPPPPPLRAIMFSLSEGLWTLLLSVMMGQPRKAFDVIPFPAPDPLYRLLLGAQCPHSHSQAFFQLPFYSYLS